MTPTRLIHYGLQRSGTNYLETLLRRRYRLRLVNNATDRASAGHKHVRLYPQKDLVPEPQYFNDLDVPDFAAFKRLLDVVPDGYVVISKDPYSWFLSYQRFATRCGWPEPEHHYIDEYNHFYGTWLKLAAETDRFVFVRYIDLLTDTDATMQTIQKTFGLKPRRGAVAARRRVRRVKVSEKFTDDSVTYYRERRYLDEFDPATLAELARRIDPDVAARLGYLPDSLGYPPAS